MTSCDFSSGDSVDPCLESVLTAARAALCVVVLLLSSSAAVAQQPLTSDQWRQDLHYLAKELPSRHKNAFHTTTREKFEKAVAELDAAIPTLQPHEVIVGMMRIVAISRS